MNPITLEWVGKAEGDFATAGRELGVSNNSNHDAVEIDAREAMSKCQNFRQVVRQSLGL